MVGKLILVLYRGGKAQKSYSKIVGLKQLRILLCPNAISY